MVLALAVTAITVVAVQAVASRPVRHRPVLSRKVTVAPAYGAFRHVLYPGVAGDVALAFVNTGTTSLLIKGIVLPPATSLATGWRDAAGRRARAGCTARTSGVRWAAARSGRTTVVWLRPFVLAPRARRIVVLPRAAVMARNAPRACAAGWLGLPRLRGVVVRRGVLPAG